MKWNFAGLLTVFVVNMQAPPPADACGVKLTIKSSAPRKNVARTSNPSQVLLLGSPPRRLERDLSAAGHRVEVAPTAAAAKRKSYTVVIVDSKQQAEARSSFAGAVVLVRSGDVVADMRSVESQVARKPIQTDESRAILAARSRGTPIATGPAKDTKTLVATKEPTPTKEPVPVPVPEPAPVVTQPKVVTTVPKVEPKPAVAIAIKPPVEPKPVVAIVTKPPVEPDVVTPTVDPKPKTVVKAVAPPPEVYFGLNSAKSTTASLTKAVRWLNAKADLQVVIEGHADPTGNPQDNMTLSQKRAEWVRDYLVSAGIDQSRLEVISFGDTRLKYSKTDSRNRRVKIVAK